MQERLTKGRVDTRSMFIAVRTCLISPLDVMGPQSIAGSAREGSVSKEARKS
jgi:hypothetical protein